MAAAAAGGDGYAQDARRIGPPPLLQAHDDPAAASYSNLLSPDGSPPLRLRSNHDDNTAARPGSGRVDDGGGLRGGMHAGSGRRFFSKPMKSPPLPPPPSSPPISSIGCLLSASAPTMTLPRAGGLSWIQSGGGRRWPDPAEWRSTAQIQWQWRGSTGRSGMEPCRRASGQRQRRHALGQQWGHKTTVQLQSLHTTTD